MQLKDQLVGFIVIIIGSCSPGRLHILCRGQTVRRATVSLLINLMFARDPSPSSVSQPSNTPLLLLLLFIVVPLNTSKQHRFFEDYRITGF